MREAKRVGDEDRSTCAQAQLAGCRLRVVGVDWAGRLAGCVCVCVFVSVCGVTGYFVTGWVCVEGWL